MSSERERLTGSSGSSDSSGRWSPTTRRYVQFTREQTEYIANFFKDLYVRHFPCGAAIEAVTIGDEGSFTVRFAEGAGEEDRANFELLVTKYSGLFSDKNNKGLLFSDKFSINPLEFSDEFKSVAEYRVSSKLVFNKVKQTFLEGYDRTTLESTINPTPRKSFYTKNEAKYGQVPGLNLKGLALMNAEHGVQNVFICQDTQAFIDVLKLLESDDIPVKLDLMLVRTFADGHVQPIKVERREGKNHLVITDSSTDKKPYLKDTLDLLATKASGAEIFYTHEPRQTDLFSCYVATAKDLSKMARTPHLYMELKLQSSTSQNPDERGDNFYRCATPARFFSLVQSRSYMIDYIMANTEQAALMLERKKGEGSETLKDRSFRERVCGDMKTPHIDADGDKIPRVIDYFAHKYAAIIDRSLTEQDYAAVKKEVEKQDSKLLTVAKLQTLPPCRVSPRSLPRHVETTAGVDIRKSDSCVAMLGRDGEPLPGLVQQ